METPLRPTTGKRLNNLKPTPLLRPVLARGGHRTDADPELETGGPPTQRINDLPERKLQDASTGQGGLCCN